MNEIGMSEETKKLYYQFVEAKATMDDLHKKIDLIEPYYSRVKAIYENARLAELKSMDYKTYLKTDEWQRKRLDAIENARGVCEICGSGIDIQVHHKTYERRNKGKFCTSIYSAFGPRKATNDDKGPLVERAGARYGLFLPRKEI